MFRAVQKFFLIPALLVALLITQTACPFSKATALSWSEKAVSGLEKALPMLVNAGVNGARVQEAVDIGNQLIIAFKANNNESAIGLTSSLIVAFEGIVVETERIGNPATRTLILAVLAVVDLALGFIVDEMATVEPRMPVRMRGAPAVVNIRRYHAKKRWNCRNSQTGRYEKMKFCKEHPDVSQVEVR